MITDVMLRDLAETIKSLIQADFKDIYLSGNLRDTISVERAENGFRVIVDARMYDIDKYLKDQVIIYEGEGSYASQVDKTGGFSGKHKNYVDRAIKEGISVWLKKHNLKGVAR